MMHARCYLLCCVLLAVACGDGTGPPRTDPDGPLLFATNLNGRTSVHTMRPDGSSLRTIATDLAGYRTVAWSPDRKSIALGGGDANASALWLMNDDGTNLRPVFARPGLHVGIIDWSPDARRIAFDGCEVIVLPPSLPQGTRVECAIYSVAPTGTQLDTILRSNLQPTSPSWSADGSRIAFIGAADSTNRAAGSRLYTMRADGTDVRAVPLPAAIQPMAPSWSPDGRMIAYVDGFAAVRIVTPDGSGAGTLAHTPGDAYLLPAWSPDGRRVAFIDNTGIAIVRSDGSQLTRPAQPPDVSFVTW